MNIPYAAHLVFIHDRPTPRHPSPERFLVEETIFLLFADTWSQAKAKAAEIGRSSEIIDETMTVNNVTVTMFFVGVRKVWEVMDEGLLSSIKSKRNPIEISFMNMIFDDRKSVNKYAKGGEYGPIVKVPRPPKAKRAKKK